MAHGAAPSDRDVDRVYEVFVPSNATVVADYAALIPGVVETVSTLRSRGFKIGSTTGYTRDIMERLLPVAVAELERAGAHYVVDSVAELMPIIDRIEGRLARGEGP
jgi:phosphonoacetaldehyde hydrolase